MIKKLKTDKDEFVCSKNERQRMNESLKIQNEMTPRVLALLKEADLNPFTSIEVLGSSMLMLMCLIQELNCDADMEETFSGFFDKMKERIRTELYKARSNGQQNHNMN